MATFKVGDRVRITGGAIGINVGKTATVISGLRWGVSAYTGRDYEGHYLDIDGLGRRSKIGAYCYPPEWLAPLAPPRADAWAADKVKQVTKPTYLEPVRTKERA